MSRHGKNNTASSFFTYHEKKKLGLGTVEQRLGADSMKDFDACTLCLHTVVTPLACPEGHIFCKECIYENLMQQKKELSRQKKEYELQQEHKKAEEARKNMSDHQKELKDFKSSELGLLPTATRVLKDKDAVEKEAKLVPAGYDAYLNPEGQVVAVKPGTKLAEDMEKMEGAKKINEDVDAARAHLKHDFWLPDNTPSSGPKEMKAPSQKTKCGTGTHKLRLKDLFEVKFKASKTAEIKDPNAVTSGRYECPTCNKTFTNGPKIGVVRKCGHAFCRTCVDKLVAPEKKCLVCNFTIKSASDVVQLESGGTGYAGHGGKLVAKKYSHTGSF